MRAGQLGKRIRIERLQSGVDEIGQPITGWSPVFDAWASMEPLTGREYIAAGAEQSEVTTRVRLRYRPGITIADRVCHEGKLFNIVSVIDYRCDHRELILMCKG